MTQIHHPVFQKFGRSYHLRIESVVDLRSALELDEALWVATSAPIGSLRCDEVFLRMLDRDGDGRIRAEDFKQTIEWAFETLSDPLGIEQCSDSLRITSINSSSADGKRIQESIKKILARLDRAQAGEISLQEIRSVRLEAETNPVSEAGVVLPEAAPPEEGIGEFIEDVISSVGGVPHPSGTTGLDQEKLEEFFRQATEYLDWHRKGALSKGESKSEILPLGDSTEEGFQALSAATEKMEQYFFQCEMLALDEKLGDFLFPTEVELRQTDFADTAQIEKLLREAPLAQPRADRSLDLNGPFNPFYQDAIERLKEKAIYPLFGRQSETLTLNQWKELKATFEPFDKWKKALPQNSVEPLGAAKLEKYLQGNYRTKVETLIARSAGTALQLENIRLAEKLVCCQAYLLELANNFISFPDLYDPQGRALFDMGCLIMDGRKFNLAVGVGNRGEHVKIAESSNIFVLYVEITGGREGKSFEVAVPVTSGGRGNLVVGKRGIFFDETGRQWDARVTHIIENPISLTEAMSAPFRKIGALITGKIEKWTSSADKELGTLTQQSIGQVRQGAPQATTPATAQSTVAGRGVMAGSIMAGGGVAIAAIGSSLGYLTKIVSEYGHNILWAVGGAILAVLIPTMVLAILRLRRRDLSAILEGSEWAINARMRLTRDQCRYFTERPPFPKGSHKKRFK